MITKTRKTSQKDNSNNMKIRLTKKTDKKSAFIINLSKVAAVGINKDTGLEVYQSIDSKPICFSPKEYIIEFVEVSATGALAYIKKPIEWILDKYSVIS